jgi:hypothetical protein
LVCLVPQAGLEPARPFRQQILSLPRLPFRHWGTGRYMGQAKAPVNRALVRLEGEPSGQ